MESLGLTEFTANESEHCISALRQTSTSSETLAILKPPRMIYVRSGQGEPTNALCGTPKYVIACNTVDLPHRDKTKRLVFHNCKSLTCPKCYQAGAKRGAKAIRERLEGMAGAYRVATKKLGKKKHIVLSPPQKDWPIERLERDGGKAFRRKATQLLKRFAKDGAEGGTLIVHGERRKHHDGTECDKDGCTRRHVWIWGPHIHYIGYGFLENSDFFHARTGWIYKRVEDKGERDLFATAYYLLTHSANFVDEYGQRKGIGYFHVGYMANCKGGGKVIDKKRQVAKCSCGQELWEFGLVWDGMTPTEKVDWECANGAHYEVIITREWYLTGKVYRQMTIAE